MALNIQDYPVLVSVSQEQKRGFSLELRWFRLGFSSFPSQTESDCLSLNKL